MIVFVNVSPSRTDCAMICYRRPIGQVGRKDYGKLRRSWFWSPPPPPPPPSSPPPQPPRHRRGDIGIERQIEVDGQRGRIDGESLEHAIDIVERESSEVKVGAKEARPLELSSQTRRREGQRRGEEMRRENDTETEKGQQREKEKSVHHGWN